MKAISVHAKNSDLGPSCSRYDVVIVFDVVVVFVITDVVFVESDLGPLADPSCLY